MKTVKTYRRHTETVYQAQGFENQREYYSHLAEENDVPLSTVLILADVLGPNEDFDGLVSAVEDACGY